MKFKTGDRVKLKYYGKYAYGKVTIAKENESKVLFDGDFDLSYYYYPNDELELAEELEDPRNEDKE